MVLTHPLYCPVRCIEGHRFDEAVASVLGGRSYALVTSKGWVARGAAAQLAEACGAPVATMQDIDPNPSLSSVIGAAASLKPADVVVALGGGSVIDAAKGMVALNALEGDEAAFTDHLRNGTALPVDLDTVPIIAIPTTSGTGSEVTRWGTIWGDDRVKYSVTCPALYPTHAVLDPDLCTSMPVDLTLGTGLDAMSHAMEAVWNRRHTDATDMIAEQAIRLTREVLPQILKTPSDRMLRSRMQTAALLAGFAMGTTQTAIAHSISYPFTSRFGLPHGVACSFTLAEVVRYNAKTAPDRLQPIARAFDCTVDALGDAVEGFLADLGIGEELARYVTPDAAEAFGNNLITPARAANNIREIDGPEARELAGRALSHLHPDGTA